MKTLVIYTGVDGYSRNEVATCTSTLTVQQLISRLQEFDPETRIVASVQDGYAYSAIRNCDFRVWEED